MATSLVTGGAGFLGSHLCEALLAKGHRVVCLDNFETGSLANIEHLRDDAFAFVHHDVSEPIAIDEPLDFVYHLAALASPIDYMRLPLHSLKTGSYGTHHSLGLAKWKRARFLLASTSEVYGDPEIHPQPETYWGNVNPIGPRGVYDEAKRYAEALTMAYHRQQGVDTAIVRIFNSISPTSKCSYDDGRELQRDSTGELAIRLVYLRRRRRATSPSARRAVWQCSTTSSLPAFEYPLEGFSVPAFDGAGRMVARRPRRSLIAHPSDAAVLRDHDALRRARSASRRSLAVRRGR